jgi:prophage regulatory protein
MSNETEVADGVLRLPQVMALVGLSKSSFYAMQAAGTFPASFVVGARARGWLRSEIAAYVERCAKRRTPKPRKSAAVADQLLECPPAASA